MLYTLSQQLHFFMVTVKKLLGVKGPPTNSKIIISLCNQVVLVKVNIPVHYHVKKCRNKICQGPISFFDGNNNGSFSRNGSAGNRGH